MVPCSIWMPPAASGPVLTVRSPILTGLPWANAGAGIAIATAEPARNARRVNATDRHVAHLLPQPVHLRKNGLVRLLDVDWIRDRHPARPPGDPEHLRAIVL